jgi:hypothetical protein
MTDGLDLGYKYSLQVHSNYRLLCFRKRERSFIIPTNREATKEATLYVAQSFRFHLLRRIV